MSIFAASRLIRRVFAVHDGREAWNDELIATTTFFFNYCSMHLLPRRYQRARRTRRRMHAAAARRHTRRQLVGKCIQDPGITLSDGQKVAGYRVLRLLGSGMGEVYHAKPPSRRVSRGLRPW